ncbi:MAG: hypothetical protein HY508_00165, partial [Acidobacteria bacterium]|nr:hypothetical protein [Acidobacteriota bacterium]
ICGARRTWSSWILCDGPYLAWRALSPIDLALWDLLGNPLDTPVYQLIGGKSNPLLSCPSTVTSKHPKFPASGCR